MRQNKYVKARGNYIKILYLCFIVLNAFDAKTKNSDSVSYESSSDAAIGDGSSSASCNVKRTFFQFVCQSWLTFHENQMFIKSSDISTSLEM